MLDKNKFKTIIQIVSENFGFEICDIIMKMTYSYLEQAGINNKVFEKGMLELVTSTTQEEWNKKYGYGGKPALADWLKIFKDIRHDEKNKELGAWCTATKIINFAKTPYSKFNDSDEKAMLVLSKYGGINKIRGDLKTSTEPDVKRHLARLAFKTDKVLEKNNNLFLT